MKTINFQQYMNIQARFLSIKQAQTKQTMLFLAVQYAEKLSNKLTTKYKVMR